MAFEQHYHTFDLFRSDLEDAPKFYTTDKSMDRYEHIKVHRIAHEFITQCLAEFMDIDGRLPENITVQEFLAWNNECCKGNLLEPYKPCRYGGSVPEDLFYGRRYDDLSDTEKAQCDAWVRRKPVCYKRTEPEEETVSNPETLNRSVDNET